MNQFVRVFLSLLFAGLVLAAPVQAGSFDLYYWTDATSDHQVGTVNNWDANYHDGSMFTTPADAVPGDGDIAMFTLPGSTAQINATSNFAGDLVYPGGIVNEFYVGEGTVGNWPRAPSPGPGHLVVQSTTVNYRYWMNVGRMGGPTGGTSTLDLYGAILNQANTGGWNIVGERSVATITLNDGSQWDTREWSIIGYHELANALVTLNDSTWNCLSNDITIGYYPVADNAPTAATGVLTLNGASVLDATGRGLVVGAENGNGTLNLNGTSTAKVSWMTTWSHASETSTINFDGGTLVATAENADLLSQSNEATPHIYVKVGGAKIDTGGYNVGIWEPLEEDPTSLGGSFEKKGSGTLTLSGACTYGGDTLVSAGTLSTGAADVLPDDTVLRIAVTGGATVDLNFSGTDTIAGLFFDAVEQAAGTWGALGSGAENESSYFTGTGLLDVVVPFFIPGDADRDGYVDEDDAAIVASNWGAYDPATIGWEDGDFNGDHRVGPADAALLTANWRPAPGEAAVGVPEPSVLALLAGLTLAWLPRGSRR